VETSGPTVVDAIDKALALLGATEDEVEVEILAEGGFSEPARVQVKLRDERAPEEIGGAFEGAPVETSQDDDDAPFTSDELNDQADEAVDFLQDLLDRMDFDADVEEEIAGEEIYVDLIGDDMGLLIGRHGATLEAIQDLARSAVKHATGRWPNLTVDVEGYQERRRDTLTHRAESLADKVLRTRSPVEMPPMSAAERKVVHEVISQIPGVRTESEGQGQDRHIVLYPA
jgi:spoIIIJ-associated protein